PTPATARALSPATSTWSGGVAAAKPASWLRLRPPSPTAPTRRTTSDRRRRGDGAAPGRCPMSRYPEPLTWGQILAYRDAEARDECWCGPYSSAPICPATHHDHRDDR